MIWTISLNCTFPRSWLNDILTIFQRCVKIAAVLSDKNCYCHSNNFLVPQENSIMYFLQILCDTMFSESFPDRVKYHTHVTMYKILNNMAPDYLRQLFQNVSETHDRAIRSADNELLTTSLCRTTYYEKSFTVAGAREWNSLPLNLRKLPTIQSFKTAVKSYLLNE